MTTYNCVLLYILFFFCIQQYELVDYCCFHLTSGANTTVGPYIVHRNRKRFLISRSTLREEFVEKKYQVFDNGPSNHSSPGEPLVRGWSEFKSRGILESVNHNIDAVSPL